MLYLSNRYMSRFGRQNDKSFFYSRAVEIRSKKLPAEMLS